MTREEILRMEAGPELDRLIAERVMGWKAGADFFVADGKISRIHRATSGTAVSELWSPSTDIAAAMEVVNKLLSRYNISIYSGRYPIRWFVQIVAVEDWETKALVEDENLPLAICRAALLAAMETSDE